MIKGIQSGMLMQRGKDNTCKIFIETDEQISAVSCFDKSGNSVPAKLAANELTGIPVGGPYTLFINSEIFNNLFVGDLWILAGQSNMEGHGLLADEDRFYKKNENIRAFYMNDKWGAAKNPIHQIEVAVDKVHMYVLNGAPMGPEKGVSPGLPFAIRMYELTGVPQGVIPCAHGGTSLDHWDPNIKALGGDKSLYGAMLRRFKVNGSHIKGIFWFQGCQDAIDLRADVYKERCTYMFNEMRKDMGTCPEDGVLPIVQCQVCRWTDPPEGPFEEWTANWPVLRNVQLEMANEIERVDTVASVGLSLSDGIHLDSRSQHIIGKKAAEAMLCMTDSELAEKNKVLPAMKINKIVYDENSLTLIIKNSVGSLHATPVVKGFNLVKKPDFGKGRALPCKAYCSGNEIHVEYGIEKEKYSEYSLYYGYGLNTECNIYDDDGNSVPAFGPVEIK